MTSSYGYQRPLSNEEQLYLQNQALQAELQRREQEKPGDFIDTLGKTALAAGAVVGAGLVAALNPAQRAKLGRNLSSTVDLSKQGVANIRRLGAARVAPQEVVPASRPAPATSAERIQQGEEVVRQSRAEKIPGTVLVDLPQPKTAIDPWTGRETITDPFGVGTVPTPVSRETARGTFLPQGRATTEELAARKKLLEDTELLKYVEAEEMAAANVLPENRAEQARQQAQVRRAYSALAEQARADLLAEQTETVAKAVNTSQAAAQSDFGPQQFIQDAGYVEADNLVDQYRGGSIGRIDQFANAANSAEDQATGRMKMALQRNEDTNLAAIEMAEDAVDAQIAKAAQGDPTVASVTELDSAINQVASTLPDGLPVDQAERLNIRTQGIDLRTGERFPLASERPYRGGLQPGMQLEAETQAPSKGMEAAQKFLTSERAEIASQLGEQGLPATASRVEAELANRLSGPKAWEYGPEYTQRKQALQLGATYDPDLLESVATGVKPSGEVTIAGETVPVSSLREPVVMEETAQRLQERVAEKKDWLGNIRLEEQNNQIRISRELDKLSTRDQNISNYIDYVESEFPRKAFYSSPYERNITAKKQYEAEGARIEQEQISNQMENLLQQARKSQRRVAGAERSTQEQIANLQVPEKLKSGIEEGQRIYFEQDPVTGAPIPGTQELRSERYAVETEAKRGGGRQVVEYDPLGQSGQSKDVYGTRLSTALTDDPTKRPTKTGPSREPLTQPVTPQGLRGIDVTRDIMRIEKSAPPEKAKQMVAEYLRKLQG